MNPTRTQAIKAFLIRKTHADLAALYKLEMECQVNVAQDGGTRVEGDFKGRQWHGWTDGIQTWKSFRIPLKAKSEPEYEDKLLNFDLAQHVEGIGMTGWDWKARQSLWVAYDFDAITGHSDKHSRKLSDVELHDIQLRMQAIPWCTVRKSTSGKGLHLYVFLTPIPTANHTEHAALSRAILGMLSSIARFDFSSKIDVCGGNMWVWHRKMAGTDGLKLLKAGQLLTDIPLNWKDHVAVVSGKRHKILPPSIQAETADEKLFNELVGKSSRIPLDEEHTKLLNWLREHNCAAWWDQDHWMLVTHTYHLKQAFTSLQMRGLFDTLAQGTEAPSDHNCYAFPRKNGAWVVRRYTLGVMEASCWDQDGAGWTRTYLNQAPDLKTAAKAFDGVELPKGGFSFHKAEKAKQAAELLGAKVELPESYKDRPAVLKEHKDGRLIIELDKDDRDSVTTSEPLRGWVAEKKKYVRVLDARTVDPHESDISTLDDLIRHLVGQSGDDGGWVVKSDGGIWRSEPLTHVKHFLLAQGYASKDVTSIIGASVARCWTLVNKPFEEEYPIGREWNRNSAQLRYYPNYDDNRSFPTWLKILNHCGQNLDKEIKANPWCQANGILSGADYLKCWIASLFQQPLEPLPYLFFFGEQGTGKSIFHEALSLLVTHGVVRADQALTSNFNGELANAIVCIVEETDLRRNKQAYNKIKDWVTAQQLSIRALYEAPYMIPNATHYIQCSNDHLACPIFPGDTRITYIYVDMLNDMIPKKQLFPMLQKEAPDFLGELLSLELPPTNDRLNIPVIETQEKHIAVQANRSLLEEFLNEQCYHINGSCVKFSEFYNRFLEWLDPSEVRNWTKIRVGRELPPRFPKGRLSSDNGQFYIGNVAFEEVKAEGHFVLKGDKLLKEVINGSVVTMER